MESFGCNRKRGSISAAPEGSYTPYKRGSDPSQLWVRDPGCQVKSQLAGVSTNATVKCHAGIPHITSPETVPYSDGDISGMLVDASVTATAVAFIEVTDPWDAKNVIRGASGPQHYG